MDAVAYGKPIIPRSGYLVEFNALWYNILRFSASLIADKPEQRVIVDRLNALGDKLALSFKDMFLNDYGYLFDYVDGNFVKHIHFGRENQLGYYRCYSIANIYIQSVCTNPIE